ncbi:hypothetical protein CNMCM5878_001473 [Aspergillus fumigatiaffinis]|nr:hypothetical protein CNMCM5878_001473 [Aspergillus fumigatiaffinis]
MSGELSFPGPISGRNVVAGIQANSVSVNYFLNQSNESALGDDLSSTNILRTGRHASLDQTDSDVNLEISIKPDDDFKVQFSLNGAPRIGTFVGQQDHLDLLKEYHLSHLPKDQSSITIIHGLGGIGKTQLALQFARLHRNEFTAVFWISGRTEETLRAGFVSIVERVKNQKVMVYNEDIREKAFQSACAWLNHPENVRWLLILDNIDKFQEDEKSETAGNDDGSYNITKYLDHLNQGSIIITTRLSHLAQLGASIHVDKLSLDNSVQLLRSIVKRKRDDEVLRTLAERLDGLPLTLNHAGCYIAQRQITPHQYLERYEKELEGRNKLLNYIPRASSYNISMAATWEVSLRAIEDESASAVRLLEYCAFLHHSDIFYEIFNCEYFENNDFIAQCTQNQDYFQDQVAILGAFSFIRLNEEGEIASFSIHPVVQDWVRDRIDAASWAHRLREIIALMTNFCSRGKPVEEFLLQRRVVPHADRCKSLFERFPNKESFFFPLLHHLGKVFLNVDRADDAEEICLTALDLYQSYDDFTDSSDEERTRCQLVLSATKLLGRIYLHTEKLDLAQSYYTTALMDPINDTYLETALDLADTMMRKHDYHRADSLLTEILVQITKKLGIDKFPKPSENEMSDHERPSIDDAVELTDSPASESTTDSDQGDLSQSDRDLICNCFRTMANNARKQGNLDRAKEYMNIGMRFVKTQLVPDTVLTPVFLLDLCKIYQEEGDLCESERIVNEALEESERILGPNHPLSLDIREVLVQVLVQGDNYEVAESCHRQLLQLKMEGLGKKHPRTLTCLSNFSSTLQSMNKFDEAEECARLAFEGLKDIFDWNHKWLRAAAVILGTAYGHNLKTNEAETLFKELLHHLKQDPYTQDSSILVCLANLAQVYTSQKRPELAEATYKEAIEEYGAKLRKGHSSVLMASLGLASLYLSEMSELEKARPIITGVYDLCQELLSPNHAILREARAQYELLKKLDNLKAEAEEPMPIMYRVACGDPRSEEDFFYVELSETAPAFLGETIDKEAEEMFLEILVDRHHMSFLKERSWRCVACNSPSSYLLHHTAALLRPELGAARNFTPSVIDFAIPFCEPDTECDYQAAQLALQSLKEALPLHFSSESQ